MINLKGLEEALSVRHVIIDTDTASNIICQEILVTRIKELRFWYLVLCRESDEGTLKAAAATMDLRLCLIKAVPGAFLDCLARAYTATQHVRALNVSYYNRINGGKEEDDVVSRGVGESNTLVLEKVRSWAVSTLTLSWTDVCAPSLATFIHGNMSLRTLTISASLAESCSARTCERVCFIGLCSGRD